MYVPLRFARLKKRRNLESTIGKETRILKRRRVKRQASSVVLSKRRVYLETNDNRALSQTLARYRCISDNWWFSSTRTETLLWYSGRLGARIRRTRGRMMLVLLLCIVMKIAEISVGRTSPTARRPPPPPPPPPTCDRRCRRCRRYGNMPSPKRRHHRQSYDDNRCISRKRKDALNPTAAIELNNFALAKLSFTFIHFHVSPTIMTRRISRHEACNRYPICVQLCVYVEA